MTLPVVFAFGSVSAVVWIMLDLMFSDDREVSRRLKGLTDYETQQVKEAEPLLLPFVDRVLRPMGRSLVQFARLFAPSGYRDRLKVRLRSAGNPRGLTADRFLIAKSVLALGAVGFWGIVALLAGWSLAATLVTVGLFAAFSFWCPDLWLHSTLASRRHALVRALPDALDMLTISVEAGLGFDQAVAKLVKNSAGPLPEELGRMLQEVQSGLSRREALKSLSERVNVPELSAFTAALVQADIFGISIANVLRIQSKEMRVKRRQLAEEQAQKAPVKMVFPLILCILPATFIVIMGPAVITIGKAFGLL